MWKKLLVTNINMLPQYHMAPVNILLTLIFTGFIFILFNIKRIARHSNYSLFVLVLSIFVSLSMFRAGPFGPGDFIPHITLSMSFFNSLSEGFFTPKWASEICGGYGCPVFLFFYHSPYYIISIFHLIGFSFINSTKLLLGISFFASGLFMYWWLKRHVDNLSAFFGSVLYMFAPYHLVDMYFRVTLGEAVLFSIIPLLTLVVDKIVTNNKNIWKLFFTILVAFTILTHQALSIIVVAFAFSYYLFQAWSKGRRNISDYLGLVVPLVIGVLITSYYWVPMITESKYVHQSQIANINYLHITDLLYSPYKFGFMFQGPDAQLTDTLGYIPIAMVFFAFIFLGRKFNRNRKILLFFLSGTFISIFMTLSYSKPIWEFVPLMMNFQYSHRFLLITSFLISVLGAIVVSYVKNWRIIVVLTGLTILFTVFNWGSRETLPGVTDNTIALDLYKRGDFNYTPIWFSPKLLDNPISDLPHYEVLEGNLNIYEEKYNSHYQEILINAITDSKLKINTAYYPRWKANLDGFQINVINQDGIINIMVPKGQHNVQLLFK